MEMSERLRASMASDLIELLRGRAQQHPQKRAITFLSDGQEEVAQLTYGELDLHAQAIAAGIQRHVSSGERVLLLYPPGVEFVTAFFGCLYAGGIAVPVYPPHRNRPLPRIQAIAVNAQATLALTTANILKDLERRLIHAPELKNLSWLATDSVPLQAATDWTEPAVSQDTLAFLQYTSGSTAAPKGVMVSHGNLLQNERMVQSVWGNNENSTIVSWLPYYHDMGLVGIILQSIYTGADCILMAPLDFLQRPYNWLSAISRYKARFSGGPNFAYDLCVRRITEEQRANLDLSSWEVAFNGAEPVRCETLKRFATAFEPCGFNWKSFSPGYGLAEATLVVSSCRQASPPVVRNFQTEAQEASTGINDAGVGVASRQIVSCGPVLSGQEVVVVDCESLSTCPPGRVGEIWVAGDNVAQGYWNRPEETEATFHAYLSDTGRGPFLRTGDLGFLWGEELFISGRLKDLIIIDGRNIYPQDIEQTVEESHQALRPGCGAAFSIEVEGEERVVVMHEIERGYREADASEIIAAIRAAVATEHDLRLHAVKLLKAGTIPKTSSGKIQRYLCRSSFMAGSMALVS